MRPGDAPAKEEKGVMALSDRPATLRDVAAAARVHPATASRALNPGTRLLVSEDTARRVTEAAERL
jgi:LacI family transcriptional regulator